MSRLTPFLRWRRDKLPLTKRLISIWLTLSFASLPFSHARTPDEEKERPDLKPVMLAFSRAMRELDRGDADAVLSAEALKSATKTLTDLTSQTNAETTLLFNEYTTAIDRLSTEMVSLSKKKRRTEIAQVVEDIRGLCITCHVRYRAENNERALFPARANTISGQVKIRKLDGKERADRSDVVVFIDRVRSDTGFPLPRHNPVISQKGRRFTPKVLPIMKGTTVDFPNDDKIFHNIFSRSKTQPFDLDVYPPGELKSVSFAQTGWVKIYCNIHPQMISHILVLDNPFFSLTDSDGVFVIPEVPDGEYTLRTWHEFGTETQQKIKVVGASRFHYTLAVQEDRKFVQHKDKFGKSYKGKYK